MKTKAVDDAGKEVKWNEEHMLVDIAKAIKNKESLVFSAMDKNAFSDDPIGISKPIAYNSLTKPGVVPLKVLLFDSKGKEDRGFINITTEYTAP